MAPNTKRVFYFERLMDPVYTAIIDRHPGIELTKLAYRDSAETNWAVIRNAHAYQITSGRDELPADYVADAAFLARAPGLLVVSTNGAGYDTVDVEACTKAGVIVVNQAGGNREAVAEHVLAMMLTLAKKLMPVDRVMRRQKITNRTAFIGNDMLGKTIGIIGLGNVGARVAELCQGLLAMRVLAYDPYLTPEECMARHAEKADLDEVLRLADVISINCPLTHETANMIDARALSLMKPTTYFINTARGGIHDETALAKALEAGRLAGAGLDVWDVEPPPLDHPLLGFDNVIVSPHTAGVTVESRHKIATYGAEQMIHLLEGNRPPRLLNPEAWPAYAKRFAAAFGKMPRET